MSHVGRFLNHTVKGSTGGTVIFLGDPSGARTENSV